MKKNLGRLRPPHKLIGLMGVILLILYVILALGYPPFRTVTNTFISLLTAVVRDLSLAFVLVPIYITWIATDYFVERKTTSLGNAATNGFMGFWVGITWIRAAYLTFASTGSMAFFIGRLVLAIIMMLYGAFVVKEAVQGKTIAHIIGRVREVAYFAIMLTPIVYEVVPSNLVTIATVIIFFPLFHGIIEFLEYYLLPAPKTEISEDEEVEGI